MAFGKTRCSAVISHFICVTRGGGAPLILATSKRLSDKAALQWCSPWSSNVLSLIMDLKGCGTIEFGDVHTVGCLLWNLCLDIKWWREYHRGYGCSDLLLVKIFYRCALSLCLVPHDQKAWVLRVELYVDYLSNTINVKVFCYCFTGTLLTSVTPWPRHALAWPCPQDACSCFEGMRVFCKLDGLIWIKFKAKRKDMINNITNMTPWTKLRAKASVRYFLNSFSTRWSKPIVAAMFASPIHSISHFNSQETKVPFICCY